MALRWLRVVWLMAGILCVSWPAGAEPVTDLYALSVPVAGQGGADLQRAAATGLRELAVRISGRSDAQNNPALAAAFASADRYLDQYRFERNASNVAGALPWLAQLRYSADSVDQLLRGAGLPIWGASRPVLQVWLAVDDGKSRRILTDGDDTLAGIVRQQALRRGVLVKFPKSAAGISVDDIAQFNVAKVQAGAALAQGEVLLLGQLVADAGAVKGRWLLASATQPLSAQGDGVNQMEAVQPAFDRLIDGLSAQYAVAPSNGAEGVTLRVSGIDSFDDYAALLNYLARLAAITSASPVQIVNDEVTLQLKTQGSVEQLMRQFALESRLAPVADTAPVPALMRYRWTAPRG